MMRAWALLVILLPTASAAPTLLASDASGDVTFEVSGVPASGYDTSVWDLRELFIEESGDVLTFTIRMESLSRSPDTFADRATISVDMRHADRSYRINIVRNAFFDDVFFTAQLQEFDSSRQAYTSMHGLPVELDTVAGSLIVPVPRDSLLDSEGNAPHAGRSLDRIRANAVAGLVFSPGLGPSIYEGRDRMPDQDDVLYEIVAGTRQTGHAHLASDIPVRFSNGEEATFVYHVQASNLDGAVDTFDLTTSALPRGWEVTLPSDSLRIDGNTTLQVPVLVSTPFAHQHGSFESFLLEMTSRSDPDAVGRLEIGIRYPTIPQPAGHHDTLWFHHRALQAGVLTTLTEAAGQPPPTYLYMNALEDDEEDVGFSPDGLGGASFSFGTTQIMQWTIFLEPQLQMGLDFDLSREGLLTLDLQGGNLAQDVIATAELIHSVRNGDSVATTFLGGLAPTEAVTLNGRDEFEFPFVAEEDIIPFSGSASLRLVVRLQVNDAPYRIDAVNGIDIAGGSLQLPLFEYRDPVETDLSDLAALGIITDGEATKMVNPGSARIFNLTVHNRGAIDDHVEIRVNGTNAKWARVLGDDHFELAAGAERRVAVAVQVPDDAAGASVADLIVTVASIKQAGVQAQARIVAQVDALADHPDESATVEALDASLRSKDSPGPGLLLPLLAMLAAGGARGRFLARPHQHP